MVGKYLTVAFENAQNQDNQLDVEMAQTSGNLTIIEGYTGDGTLTSFKSYLDAENVTYAVYERPKRRPKN